MRAIHSTSTTALLNKWHMRRAMWQGPSTPGRTRRAPVRGAAKTRPQALAWNMGTRAQKQPALPKFLISLEEAIKACRKLERWLYNTPCTPIKPLHFHTH